MWRCLALSAGKSRVELLLILVLSTNITKRFYVFGNGELLHGASKIWRLVLSIMAEDRKEKKIRLVKPKLKDSHLGTTFTVKCTNHGNTFRITEPSDFDKIVGGCESPCGDCLACGHTCQLTCHPFGHEVLTCCQPCGRKLQCGHRCCEECHKECSCKLCKKTHDEVKTPSIDGNSALQLLSTSSSRRSFGVQESYCYAAAASAPPLDEMSPERKPAEFPLLLSLGLEPESPSIDENPRVDSNKQRIDHTVTLDPVQADFSKLEASLLD